jgi:hypothetical protein
MGEHKPDWTLEICPMASSAGGPYRGLYASGRLMENQTFKTWKEVSDKIRDWISKDGVLLVVYANIDFNLSEEVHGSLKLKVWRFPTPCTTAARSNFKDDLTSYESDEDLDQHENIRMLRGMVLKLDFSLLD